MDRFWLIIVVLIAMVAVAIILPEENLSENVKIGVSDDTSGFVIDYMIENEEIGISDQLEPYFIKDC